MQVTSGAIPRWYDTHAKKNLGGVMKTVSKMRRYVLVTVMILTGLIATAQNPRELQQEGCTAPAVRWAGKVLSSQGGADAQPMLNAPDGKFGGAPFAAGRALLGDFHGSDHYPGLSALLGKATAGTPVSPIMLAQSDVIAFESNG